VCFADGFKAWEFDDCAILTVSPGVTPAVLGESTVQDRLVGGSQDTETRRDWEVVFE
jgi:hypothetical protein